MITTRAVKGLCAISVWLTIHAAATVSAQTPYRGSPATVPGTIQSEDFDAGGEAIAYHDASPTNAGGGYRQTGVDIQAASEGGWNVGWISAGEWLTYTVDVISGGPYLLEARVASPGAGGTFHIEVAGQSLSGALTIPNTGGWQTWTTVSKWVTLSAGRQVLRVVFDASGQTAFGNLNWIRFSTGTALPYGGVPVSFPGVVHAENFDNGGEAIAYHDTTTGNSAGAYRGTDVDIQPSSLGGYNIGWISDGEWLGYSIDVTSGGLYALRIQLASPLSTGRMHARFGSVDTAAVSIPNTGGWQTWTTVDIATSLAPGPQVMTLVFDVGGFNVAGITATLIGVPSPPPPPPPPPVPVPVNVPTTYTAISDRVARSKPALPALGPAGFHFADPTFSSSLLRVTDANTRPGSPNASYRTPSASPQVAWNAASTYFYVVSTDGTIVPYSFNASTMTASRIPSAIGDGGLTLRFNVEPQFSSTNPNLIYGISSTSNNRTISRYDFSTDTYASVVNLDTIIGSLSGYVGGVMTGGVPIEYMTVFFGGGGQDQHRYLMWFPVDNLGARKIVDTVASTMNGAPTNVLLNFNLHAVTIDRSGRYVFLYPRGPEVAAPRYASPVYIWDTATDIITAVTSGGNDGQPRAYPGGHGTPGFGFSLNQDCCVSSAWDGAQWVMRSLAAPLSAWDLISPVLTPKHVYFSDHSSWANAQPNVMVPVISGTYRYGNSTEAWRAWDDEIIAIETDAPAGTGASVWRFAHHRSDVRQDANPAGLEFWYLPRPNVSPDGRWVIFTSNWEKTLGIDPRIGTRREDVFLLQLQ